MRQQSDAVGSAYGGKNLILCLSAAAFCVLLLRPLKTSWVLAPVISAWMLMSVLQASTEDGSKASDKRSSRTVLSAVLFSALLTGIFVAVWLRTLKIVSLQFIIWKRALPVLLAAGICMPCAVPFLRLLLESLLTERRHGENAAKECSSQTASLKDKSVCCLNREDRRLLLCTAVAAVSVCSLSSPLYPFNTWVDANCFFTVGKSMLYGVVPYRDLYEQKGPLLYALYASAYPVSHKSFFGVWLMEIAAAWAFLTLSCKTILLITGKKSPPALLLTAALVYTAPAFLKGGSAEEFCLPLLMLSVYYGTDCILNRRDLNLKEAFFIGLSSGAVLWVKYSMLGFYFGFILVPAFQMLKRKRAAQLLRVLLLILAGVALASLPVLLYFGVNRALTDLWQAYFYNNIFVYGKGSSVGTTVRALLSGGASMLTFNDTALLLTVFTVLSLLREGNRSYGLFIGLCFVSAFTVIYIGGINMKYYSEILCVFVPVGVAQLQKMAGRLRPDGQTAVSGGSVFRGKTRKQLLQVLIPLLFVLALFGNENTEMLKYRKTDLPQYRFACRIAETPNASLFNYGALDIGQYTVNDLVPTCRYFCMLNIQSDEMFWEMDRYMEDGITDYIVSRGLPVESPYYTLIQTEYFPDDGVLYPFYLYRHI